MGHGKALRIELLEEETTRMAHKQSRQSYPQTGRTRDESEPSRGTPSLMDSYRKRVQSNITHIRNMMLDIAHASHTLIS